MTSTSTETYRALSAAFLQSKHAAGLVYADYLKTSPDKAPKWKAIEERVHLTAGQSRLIGGFIRQMRVLCVSGMWCGDCSAQGPMLAAIEAANPGKVDLKWLDRDEHMDLAGQIMINAGHRVPTVIWMAEDYEPVHILGDRTLARYRAVAAKQLGASCPLPGAPVPAEELAETLQEWVNEFERVHLLLRLSARLREIHRD